MKELNLVEVPGVAGRGGKPTAVPPPTRKKDGVSLIRRGHLALLSLALGLAWVGGQSSAQAGDGTLWAWGYGGDGELGDGTFYAAPNYGSATPVAVNALTGGRQVAAIASGDVHSLALASDGTVWAWGYGLDGEVGNGTLSDSATPVTVTGLPPGIIAIAAGSYHSLALASDGTVWAWGYGPYGELGNDTSSDSATPVEADGLLGALHPGTTVSSIAAGQSYSMALASDGTVWVSGLVNLPCHNAFPPYSTVCILGSIFFSGAAHEVSVPNEAFVAIAAGDDHFLALASDGTVCAHLTIFGGGGSW